MSSRRSARKRLRVAVTLSSSDPLKPASNDRERTGRSEVRLVSGATPACRPMQGAAGSAQVSSRKAGARNPAVKEAEASQRGANAQVRPTAGTQAENAAVPGALPGSWGEG